MPKVFDGRIFLFTFALSNRRKTYHSGDIGSIGILIKLTLKTENVLHVNGGPRLERGNLHGRWITKRCGHSKLIILGVSSHLLPAFSYIRFN